MYTPLQRTDSEMFQLLEEERKRQREGIELIPSENIVSQAVLEALGSELTNKYSEGYPGKRYYGGNEVIDRIERLTQERAKKLFGVPHANVQPYSGSPANLAVYVATCEPGDTIMGHALPDGGHLTHGWKASATGSFYNAIQYHVNAEGYIDMDEVRELAHKHKPKLIWIGATAYPRALPFREFSQIAGEVGAYLAADISHIAGLVVGKMHESPVASADIITTTTHKTLRGPRGGMILATKKGLEKDPELGKKIDRAIFPNLQGGPHNHQIAAIGTALEEASQPEFTRYAQQIVANARALAQALIDRGFSLATRGTDNHLMLVDCGKGRGIFMEKALDQVGITVNKNTIPNESSSPFYPSGIRIGTPSITTRGMGEEEMQQIAEWIYQVFQEIDQYQLPEGREERQDLLKRFNHDIADNKHLQEIHEEVRGFCIKFSVEF